MKISPNNSHTHCQASQANATTQAWQRVCLSNCTTKTTDNQTDEKEHRSDNSGFTIKRVQWLIEHSTLHQISWYVDKFSAHKSASSQSPKTFIVIFQQKILKSKYINTKIYFCINTYIQIYLYKIL